MKNGLLAKLFILSGLCFLLLKQYVANREDVAYDDIPVASATKAPAPVAYAQTPQLFEGAETELEPDQGGAESPSEDGGAITSRSWKGIFQEFGGALFWAVWGLLEIIVRITPSERDNSIINWIKNLLDQFFPNRAKDGGTH